MAYNKNLEYLLIKIDDEGDFKSKQIIIADQLLESVIKGCKINKFEKIKKFKEEDLKNTVCRHPFYELGYNLKIPLLEAGFVTRQQIVRVHQVTVLMILMFV